MLGAVGRIALGLPVIFALVGIWAVAAAWSGQPPAVLPSPARTWQALVASIENGSLLLQGSRTVGRMLLGWGLASLLGIALGVVIGSTRSVRIYVQPTLEFIRPLPASAIMPVAILFLGLSEASILATIAFGAVWPVLLGTIYGVSSLDRRLADVARALNLSQLKAMVSLALPNAGPDIATGMRLSLTTSLIIAVVGEMLTSRPGLGLYILQAARSFNGPDVYAGTIALGIIGITSNLILRTAEGRWLRWQRATQGSR